MGSQTSLGTEWEPCEMGEVRPTGEPLLQPHPSCSYDPLGQKPAAPRRQSKPGQMREGVEQMEGLGPWGAGEV